MNARQKMKKPIRECCNKYPLCSEYKPCVCVCHKDRMVTMLNRPISCKHCQSQKQARHEEIVICAAVRTTTGKIYRGHRHGDCFEAIRSRHYIIGESPDDQGFITSKNRYVTRLEGRKLQDAARIKSVASGGYCGNTLYSEDLY